LGVFWALLQDICRSQECKKRRNHALVGGCTNPVTSHIGFNDWHLLQPRCFTGIKPPDLGVKLDFQEKTITIEEILLPMRNIVNMQLKPRITRALRENRKYLFCSRLKSQLAHAALPSAW
jgi:hypothetical protein